MGQVAELKKRTLSLGERGLWRAAVLVLLMAASSARGQMPHLVKDINPFGGPSGTFASELVAIGDTVFFVAIHPATGAELWRTNGTPEGTVLVKDIRPGPEGSRPYRPIAAGGTLFFTADDGAGRDLWKSDGTATGTTLVKGALSRMEVGDQAALNGTLYFGSSGRFGDNSTGFELWKSDGTDEGTVLVKEIIPGHVGSDPSNLTVSGGVLFFTAAFPHELWKSDGTASGTTKVADLHGAASLFIDMGGTLFFRGPAGGLWKSDGTEAGTVLVWDGGVLSEGARMTGLDGTLYFEANDGAGSALWKSNGTTAGTVRVKTVGVGYDYQGKSPFAVRDGLLYFPGCEATYGCELWRSDGTEAGTFMVKETSSPFRSPSKLTTAGGSLFFSVDDGISGEELWKSDGTAAGTVIVKDIWIGSGDSTPTALVDADGTLFFRAQDASSSGPVWKSDGTESGTVPVKRIHDGREPSHPVSLTDVNGTLFFSADDGSHGYELWRSDGTAAGTLMVRDVQSGIGGSYPNALTNVDGTLFFTAQSGTQGFLWKSDGSEAGTVLVKEFFGVRDLTPVGGTLYFAAAPALYEDNPGTELWRSDGTAAGTVMVKDIGLTPVSGDPRLLTNVGGTLFFVANDGVNGRELWKSDGTEAGTMLVKNIGPTAADSLPQDLVDIGGILFFTADDGVHGRELWKSDGTTAGTVMVKDIETGSAGSGPLGLTGFGGEVFFSAQDSTHGREIWKSDGTDAGTILVADILPGPGASFPQEFTEAAGTLFFTLGVNGRLWRTDGGEVNTIPVGDWFGGSLGPDLGGILYFVGGGGELWRSDGSASGTALVKDNYAGPTPSNPQLLTKSGSRLFFVATDGYVGRELWTLNALAPTVGNILVNPSQTTAAVSAEVSSDGGSPITERGFVYSMTDPAPEIGGADVDRFEVAGTTGFMAAVLGDLAPGMPYFVRAYAMSAAGIGYDAAVFVTGARTGPSLAINDATVVEGDAGQSLAAFTITLSAPSLELVSVQVEVAGVSATSGTDYLPLGPLTVSFEPGAISRNIAVAVLGDGVPEGPEVFKVSLGLPLNAILADATGVGTILNDDGPAVRVTDAAVMEGDSGVAIAVFTVMLSTPSSGVTSVDFATSNGTAVAPADYAGSAGTLTFAPGVVSLRVQVPVFGDTEVEPDESFVLGLDRSRGIRIADGEGTGLIKADDGMRFAISDRSAGEGDGGSRTIRLLVTLSPAAQSIATVAYTTVDGTAEAPGDYETASGILVFAPGESQKQIAVTVRGDTDAEANETFEVLLSSASGGIIADATGQVLIRDDDGATLRSRLLFHNRLTNRLFRWHMRDGMHLESFDWVTPWATDSDWSVGAVADFDDDGQADLLWHNQGDGRLLLWFLDGDALKGFQFLPYSMLPPWRVAATFDSDGSGRPDVVYQNHATGVIRVVQRDKAAIIAVYDLARTLEPPWRVAAGADVVRGATDFDDELLIQNSTTGELLWWNPSGPTVTSFGLYPETQSASPGYGLVSAGTDFNGDNLPDLLWHNGEPAGLFHAWFMNGTARIGAGGFTPFSATDPSWRVVGSVNIR